MDEYVDGNMKETPLGQHDRWMRHAPDLWERYQESLAVIAALEADDVRVKYHELLFAVETKYPSESRHDTALRYISLAEQRHSKAGQRRG